MPAEGQRARGGVRSRRSRLSLAVAVVVLAGGLTGILSSVASHASAAPASQDWPTFQHDSTRSSATTDAALSVANAPQLQPTFTTQTGGIIETSPSIVGSTAYLGSWDGYEYAINATTGAVVWKTFVGTSSVPLCYPWTLGISSTATVVNGVVYLGQGGTFYGLDATTGAILWSLPLADSSQAVGNYIWASPLVVNGSAYVSVASYCDNPVVRGVVVKVDLTAHAVSASHYFAPVGQLGGGVWTATSYDPATNRVFVANGNRNNLAQTQTQAVVALDAGTLNAVDQWQIPESQSNGDPDFGTGPVLATDTGGDQLVSAANKNGILYTWNRNNLAAGPVWQHQIAVGGQCPECGDGSISSGAYNNGVLYWAGGHNVTNGKGSGGAVTAFAAGTGQVLWTRQTDQPILGAIAYVNGMIGEAEGSTFEVLDASNGNLLYSYVLPQPVYGPVSVGQGQFFVGDTNGALYAFGVGPAPATPPADPNCPAGFTCQDVQGPAAGSESTSAGTLTVQAAGAGVKGVGDQFRLLSQPVTGDNESSAQLVFQTATAGLTPQAGLMARQSTAPGSPFYAALAYPNDSPPDVQVWYRSAVGKNPVLVAKVPTALPATVMIQRQGNRFTTGLSSDGVTFQAIPGSTASVDLPSTVLEGPAVASGSATTYRTASFANLAVGRGLATTLAPPAPADPCPSSWTCADLGNPSPIGDTTGSGGSLTLAGSGTGVGGATDSAHYVYRSTSGSSVLSAQVVAQAGASANAQEGLMVRANASPTSPMYSVTVKPGGAATIQWRVNDGVAYSGSVPIPTATSPVYLAIDTWQDTTVSPAQTEYSTLTSTDGVTWAPVLGSTVSLPFGSTNYLAGLVATAGGGGITTPVVMNGVSLGPLSSPPPGVCPSGWSCTDVGGQLIAAGNQLVGNGTWTVQGSGDIYSVFDEFRFAYQPFVPTSTNGDGTVSARVSTQTGGGPWMRSGVMLRSGTDPSAPYYGTFVTPSNGVAVQWRTAQGAQTNQITQAGLTAPRWVMASRYTDTAHGVVYYSAFSSADGVTWTYVPNSQVALTLPGPLVAGIASEADSSTNLSVATFDNVAQQAREYPPPAVCPTGWACTDIGGALPPGQDSLSAGTWTESAGGGDIWGTADSFHLAAQALAADGTVTARVVSQQSTSPWAKAGVMVRATTDPGSPYYATFVTPGNGVVVQWRTAQAGSSSQLVANATGTAPVYLRVARYTTTGSTPQTLYTAYTSADGVTWTAVPGSTTALAMPGTLQAGIALTSHSQGVAGTDVLSGVAVTPGEVPPPGLACPSGWSCGDVGGATPAGGQSLSGGTWTVLGGGSDIWGTSDAFHFAWQTLAGDGSLSARVVSQSNSSAWAKAGPMVRATNAPGSPYYAVFATPANGVVAQWRAAQGGTTGQMKTTGLAPVFLRVVRTGTTFSAFSSSDGATWTLVPGSRVTLANLSGTLLRGLAVTSHNNGKAGTVVFDTVVGSP